MKWPVLGFLKKWDQFHIRRLKCWLSFLNISGISLKENIWLFKHLPLPTPNNRYEGLGVLFPPPFYHISSFIFFIWHHDACAWRVSWCLNKFTHVIRMTFFPTFFRKDSLIFIEVTPRLSRSNLYQHQYIEKWHRYTVNIFPLHWMQIQLMLLIVLISLLPIREKSTWYQERP